MSTTAIAVIIVVAAVVCLALLSLAFRHQSKRLQDKFGSEYERSVAQLGRSKAEAELQRRQSRVRRMQIRPLSDAERERFTAAWRHVQGGFVDDPGGSLTQADRLLTEVMTTRGYPVNDFDECAADISVNHANAVSDYREAHEIALRRDRGEATTEDIRRALVHYRMLLEDLAAAPAMERARAHSAAG
jgi:hypothetical protein